MMISAHLLIAIALVASTLVVLLGGNPLRRRIPSFASWRVFVICCALLLVPANIVASFALAPAMPQVVVLMAGVAAIITQVAFAMLTWLSHEDIAAIRRVLVIAAHPDDMGLACGGAVGRLADVGHEIHALVLGDGSGGHAQARHGRYDAESLALADYYQAGLPDGELAGRETVMVEIIEEKLNSFNPDLILTHSMGGRIDDHAAVYRATTRAADDESAILCFECPSDWMFYPAVEGRGVSLSAVESWAEQDIPTSVIAPTDVIETSDVSETQSA